MESFTRVIVYSCAAAAATGLGVIPLAFAGTIPRKWISMASALAGGLLLGAVFDLVNEGNTVGLPLTLVGVAAGAGLVAVSRNLLEKRRSPGVESLAEAGVLQAVIVVAVMTVHSFAEGTAIGLSLGSHNHSFGFLIALVIALHNIPEGLAIGIVLVSRGVKLWKAGFWSIFSSLPQPIMAIPAFILSLALKPLLPFGLGLAAGALIWMIGAEVLPDACGGTSHGNIGSALATGVVLMMTLKLIIM